ncbi:MAG: acyl-[acyl-carrier-protein] thioesterase [Lewinella sp.]
MLDQSPLHEVVSFQVAASAIGPHGLLTLPHLIRMLQEAAMQNTVRLNISSPQMMEQYGCSWVLRRQRVDCLRWPGLGEELTVLTAPSGFQRKLQTFRDFHLRDQTGTTIITATTQWLFMDVSSRRLRPIPSAIADLKHDLAPAAAHLDRPDGKVPPPSKPTAAREAQVAFYQLDFNDHLTNPVFPELMLEPLGHDFLSHHLPVKADIMFQREARYGDLVKAVTGAEAGELNFGHALLRGDEPLATMQTSWRPR